MELIRPPIFEKLHVGSCAAGVPLASVFSCLTGERHKVVDHAVQLCCDCVCFGYRSDHGGDRLKPGAPCLRHGTAHGKAARGNVVAPYRARRGGSRTPCRKRRGRQIPNDGVHSRPADRPDSRRWKSVAAESWNQARREARESGNAPIDETDDGTFGDSDACGMPRSERSEMATLKNIRDHADGEFAGGCGVHAGARQTGETRTFQQ